MSLFPSWQKQNCSRDNASAKRKLIVFGRRGPSNATGSSQGQKNAVLMKVGWVAQKPTTKTDKFNRQNYNAVV